jgi:ABC-type transport system involved in cytochrome c biogenesis permease subunit
MRLGTTPPRCAAAPKVLPMVWDIRLLATVLPILYALVSVAYVLVFFRNDPLARRVAPAALATTLGLHVVYFALLAMRLRRVPIATSFESLSALALALGIAYLVQERRSGTPYTGFVFVPLVFVCQMVASAFASPNVEIKAVLQSPLFGMHIGAALLGYAAFAVSAIFGILYVLLYHNLKAYRFGIVYERLPSLEILAAMNVRAAGFGLGCLTLAIGVGAVWSLQVYPDFWQDPKVWLSLLAWVVYAACLLVRYAGGWRGPRIAYFTIAGFLLVVFSMLAANRLFPSFHDFRL